MAHLLKMPVRAEGVETKNHAEYLKGLGCRYMQGYFFGRPMPADDFEKTLRQSNSSPEAQYPSSVYDTTSDFTSAFSNATLFPKESFLSE